MEFFLCQNQSVQAVLPGPGNNGYYSRPAIFAVELTPNADAEGQEGKFWNELERLPARAAEAGGVVDVGQLRLICEILEVGNRLAFRIVSGPVTTAIGKVFGENAEIQMGITNLLMDDNVLLARVKSNKMKVRNEHFYACEDPDLFKDAVGENTLDYLDGWRTNINLIGRVTVTVGFEEEPAESERMSMADVKLVYKKMLEEAIASDLIIIGGNGAEVKAHQNILAAHSPVFRAMFEAEMKESKTRILEIRDMSEAGVRALLAYLYYREDAKLNADPLLAFEMLQAGHKYDIPVLEASMKNVMLDKPTEWFNVNFAIKLFMFAKNLPPEDGNSLKKQAIKVLKRNSATLPKSPSFTALFTEDPKAAMEFCVYVIGGNN